MGKELQQNLQQQQQQEGNNENRENGSSSSSSSILCERCSMGLSKICKDFNFKCFFILILSLCLLVSVIFWILPHRTVKSVEFDADISIKLSATVQGYFKLQKPVSELVPHIERLEYDINDEIGVPSAKVTILSMHKDKLDPSNCTEVVFGFLSDPINVRINQVLLSVLRSSLVELLLQQSNLTLTASIFGEPSGFEILKFPGGITVIPVPYASILQMPQNLFNFTLNNSISDILLNLKEFRDQLKSGLHLRAYENIVVQIRNAEGSSVNPPVTVEASVISDLGSLLPQRLKQLVQTITDSPSKNLGLDNSVFGKVKSVVLSSYLKGGIHANPPTPSPAPSPEHSDHAEPPSSAYPDCAPSLPPVSSPSNDNHSHATSPKCRTHHSLPPPTPVVPADPPHPCRHRSSPISRNPSPAHPNRSPYLGPTIPPSQFPPDLSPMPHVSNGSNPRKGSVSQSHAPAPSTPYLSYTVKAYFKLQKPALQLFPHIRRLEYDLKREIGIPTAKVAVLSVRPSGNWTDVVFGFLPERINIPINPVFLSVLRLSLVDVFLQESNLTLTTSIFGQPSAFEILKFPGGITVNPVQDAFICQMPRIFFSFVLNHSMADVLDNLNELRDQLKFGLHLRSHEKIVVQLTNSNGSTVHPPVTVQASVVSHLGKLLPQRLKQLAKTIKTSHLKNLGLDYTYFGEVKCVILSSYLKGILHANPPTSSPAPSPELSVHADPPISIYPTCSPSSSPSDNSHSHSASPKCGPHHSLPHVNSAAPSVAPPNPSGHRSSPVSRSPSSSYSNRSPYLRPMGPPSQIPSDLSPLPHVSYGSTPSKGSVSQSLTPSPSAPSPSSVGGGPFCRDIWWLGFSGLLVFHLLCCPL